jgi:hypothetical protein
MKIRAYLALMAAAILIPVIAFLAVSLNMLLKAEREAALRGVRETARIALVSIDRELTNTQATLRMLATSHYLATGQLGGFYEQARFSDKPGATWTGLLAEDGELLVSTAVPYGTPLPPSNAGPRVIQVLDAGMPQVSKLIRGVVTQELMVRVDVPVSVSSAGRPLESFLRWT